MSQDGGGSVDLGLRLPLAACADGNVGTPYRLLGGPPQLQYKPCLFLLVPQADGSQKELQYVQAEQACVRKSEYLQM